MRVIANRAATVRFRIADQDGQLVDPDGDPDTIAVTVFDGAGVAVAGAPATAAHVDLGVYEYRLAPQAKLDRLLLTAASTVDGDQRQDAVAVDVIGSRLLAIEDAREDYELSKADPAMLRRVLDSIETQFRDIIGFPVVPEAARVSFDHRSGWGVGSSYVGAPTVSGYPLEGLGGGGRLNVPGVALPIEVYAASINFSPMLTGDLALIGFGDGQLQWADSRGWPSGRYTLWLAHGIAFPDGDLVQAALVMARYLMRRMPKPGKTTSLLPERTASLTTDGATIVFARPGSDQPTGLPEVDSVLVRYRDDSVI